jgi:hypothetical protein
LDIFPHLSSSTVTGQLTHRLVKLDRRVAPEAAKAAARRRRVSSFLIATLMMRARTYVRIKTHGVISAGVGRKQLHNKSPHPHPEQLYRYSHAACKMQADQRPDLFNSAVAIEKLLDCPKRHAV